MRAIFPKARKHLALSIETPSLPELSASLSHTNRPPSLQKRLLLAFYFFGLTLWMVCAWTMRLSWLAVAVVVVATLTAGVMWRRVVPSWLAFMVMTLWGGLPFAWRSIDPKVGLAFLSLLSGAIYEWCPTRENRQKIGVPPGFLTSVAALLSQLRTLSHSARRLGLVVSWQRCLAAGVALLVVGSCFYGGYRLGQRNSRQIEIVAKHESVSTQQKNIGHHQRRAEKTRIANERMLREPETEAPIGEVSVADSGEVQQARDLYIRGQKCLNDDDVACARLYFELGAERFRSGRNAVAMGDTFNPLRLKELRIYGGVRPDIGEARKWYERARELGPSEARQRLRELDAADKGS